MNDILYTNKAHFIHLLKKSRKIDSVKEDDMFTRSLDNMIDKLKFFHSHLLLNCSPELQNDRQVVYECVKVNPLILEVVSEEFKKDKEMVYDAFLRNSFALQYAHDELKDDEQYISAILVQSQQDDFMKLRNKSVEAFRFVSKRLQESKEFVVTFLNSYQNIRSNVVECIGQNLYGDKDIVVPAIKMNAAFITKLPKHLQEDKEFVLDLIHQQYNVYPHLIDVLKKDRDIIKATLATNPIALNTSWYVDKLNCDRELVLIMVNTAPRMYRNVDNNLLGDREIIETALKKDGYVLSYLPEELKKERDLCLMALASSDKAYPELTEELKNDKDFMLEALKLNPKLIVDMGYDTPNLLNNEEIAYTYLKESLYKHVDRSEVEHSIGKELLADMHVSLNLSKEERVEQYISYLSKSLLSKKLHNDLPQKDEVKSFRVKI